MSPTALCTKNQFRFAWFTPLKNITAKFPVSHTNAVQMTEPMMYHRLT